MLAIAVPEQVSESVSMTSVLASSGAFRNVRTKRSKSWCETDRMVNGRSSVKKMSAKSAISAKSPLG